MRFYSLKPILERGLWDLLTLFACGLVCAVVASLILRCLGNLYFPLLSIGSLLLTYVLLRGKRKKGAGKIGFQLSSEENGESHSLNQSKTGEDERTK